MLRKKKKKAVPAEGSPSSPGWAVTVEPAMQRWRSDFSYHDHRLLPVEGQVAVRLTLNGKTMMTFGAVAIVDDKFEDKVTTLKAQAEDRAASLNAVGARAA